MIDERELVHEVVQELAILDQMRLRYVERLGGRVRSRRLRVGFQAGEKEAGE